MTEQAVTEQATIGGPAMDISRQEVAAERAPDPAAAPTPMRAPDATAEPSTPAKETVEAERAIEHSVEPAVRPASPAARETAVAARPALFPVVARSAAFMRGNPRVTLAVALTAGALLVGAALGYAAARRSTRAEATSAPTGRLQLDSSAASASPALRGRDTSPVNPRAGSGTQRVTAARQRTGAASGVRRRNTIVPSPGNGDATTPAAANPPPTAAAPPAAASAPIDSAVLRSRRDSALAAAHAESLAAEREAIREEIARRRARIDSILRAQGSAPATPP